MSSPITNVADARMTHSASTSGAPGTSVPACSADVDLLATTIEAILVTAGKVLSMARITEAVEQVSTALGDAASIAIERTTQSAADASEDAPLHVDLTRQPISTDQVRDAIRGLNDAYAATGRVFRIVELSGGWRLMTLPEHAPAVAALNNASSSARLSRAALETLAIIAYRQPVTRAQIDAIRGVASGEVIRTLTERGLVTISGRAEELGRPLLYATTKRFLESFGLRSTRDLPDVGPEMPWETSVQAKPWAPAKPVAATTPKPDLETISNTIPEHDVELQADPQLDRETDRQAEATS